MHSLMIKLYVRVKTNFTKVQEDIREEDIDLMLRLYSNETVMVTKM